ncbi:hypothetical protein EPN87_03870, partial [archaeon]
MKKTRLSATGISTYTQCQRKFYYRNIQKLEERVTPHMMRGKIVHKVLDDFFDTVDIQAVAQEKDWHSIWKDFYKVLMLLLDAEWNMIGSSYENPFRGNENENFLEDTKGMLDFY